MKLSCQQSGKDAPRRAGVKRRILGSTVAKALIHANDERRATNIESYFLGSRSRWLPLDRWS